MARATGVVQLTDVQADSWLAPDCYDSFPLPLLPLLLPLSGLFQVDTPPERDVAILKRVLPLGGVRLV